MKKIIVKVWGWVVGILNRVRRDRLYHFICGLIIAAFFALVLPVEWAVVPVVFVAFAKEFIDLWLDGNFDWVDFLATVIGGAIIWIFQLIGG